MVGEDPKMLTMQVKINGADTMDVSDNTKPVVGTTINGQPFNFFEVNGNDQTVTIFFSPADAVPTDTMHQYVIQNVALSGNIEFQKNSPCDDKMSTIIDLEAADMEAPIIMTDTDQFNVDVTALAKLLNTQPNPYSLGVNIMPLDNGVFDFYATPMSAPPVPA